MSVMRTKSIEQSIREGDEPEYQLKKRLTALDLTVFGVGVIIGAGIFTLTGRAAKEVAGPSIVLSFVIAAICCGLAALCYAEFASTVPVSGSAYTFSYASLGELVAWIIGWDLLLELLLGAAVVARAGRPTSGCSSATSGSRSRSRWATGRASTSWRSSSRSRSPCSSASASRSRCGSTSCSSRVKLFVVLFVIVGGHRLHQHRELHARSSRRRSRPEGKGSPGVAAHRDLLRVHALDLRRARHRRRRLARLLRLHRVRRRRDDRRGGQEPAARPADRHHRLARHLHGALLRRRPRHHRDDPVRPDLDGGRAGDRLRDGGQAGLRHAHLRRRRGRPDDGRHDAAHRRHPRALRDVARLAAPAGARQGQPPHRHPAAHHHHDRHRRRPRRGAHAGGQARVHGQHRHAGGVHPRVDRRAGAAAQAPRPAAPVQGAVAAPSLPLLAAAIAST